MSNQDDNCPSLLDTLGFLKFPDDSVISISDPESTEILASINKQLETISNNSLEDSKTFSNTISQTGKGSSSTLHTKAKSKSKSKSKSKRTKSKSKRTKSKSKRTKSKSKRTKSKSKRKSPKRRTKSKSKRKSPKRRTKSKSKRKSPISPRRVYYKHFL